MKCKQCKSFVKFGKIKGKQRYKCIKCGSSTIKNINNNYLVDRRKYNSGNPKGNPRYSKELIKKIKEKSKEYDELLMGGKISNTSKTSWGKNKRDTGISKYNWIKKELKDAHGGKFPSIFRYYQVIRSNTVFY